MWEFYDFNSWLLINLQKTERGNFRNLDFFEKILINASESDTGIWKQTSWTKPCWMFRTSKQVLVWAPLLTVCLIRDWSCRSWASRDLIDINTSSSTEIWPQIREHGALCLRLRETVNLTVTSRSSSSSSLCLHHKRSSTDKYYRWHTEEDMKKTRAPSAAGNWILAAALGSVFDFTYIPEDFSMHTNHSWLITDSSLPPASPDKQTANNWE